MYVWGRGLHVTPVAHGGQKANSGSELPDVSIRVRSSVRAECALNYWAIFSSNHSQIQDPFYSKATVCWMWWLLPVILVLRNQGKRIMSSRPVLAIYGVQGATGRHGTTVLTTRTVAMWALILVHPLRKCTLSFCLFAFLSLVCQTWNLVSEVYSVSSKELPASCIQVLAAALTISVFSVDL